jgi:hypothetical protein
MNLSVGCDRDSIASQTTAVYNQVIAKDHASASPLPIFNKLDFMIRESCKPDSDFCRKTQTQIRRNAFSCDHQLGAQRWSQRARSFVCR